MAVLNSSRSVSAEPGLGRGRRVPALSTVLASAMVAAAALMPVVQSTLATTTGYETQRLEQQRNDLQAAIYQQQTEIAQLGSLERVDREARERLKMAPATGGIAITVNRPPSISGEVPARYLPAEEEAPPPARRTDLIEWLTGFFIR